MDKFIHKYKHYIDWDYKFISMKNLLLTCFFVIYPHLKNRGKVILNIKVILNDVMKSRKCSRAPQDTFELAEIVVALCF